MKITTFFKTIACKATSLGKSVKKEQIISTVRDEVHQFAYGIVAKQLLMISAIFCFACFLLGLFVGYLAS